MDATLLTDISLRSKRYWAYPEEYFDRWRSELTINPAYIEQNDVFVLEDQGFTVGFYSLAYLANDTRVSAVTIEKDYWLDHMFVLPEYIGRGVDSVLSEQLLQRYRTKRIKEVKILADPNSRGFSCPRKRE